MRQVDLAEASGLPKGKISHYVNGRYEAKQEALYLLAKALNVNEAWLMGCDVSPDRTKEERVEDMSNEVSVLDDVSRVYGRQAAEILNLFNCLNEKGRNNVFDHITDLAALDKYLKEDVRR